VTYLEASDNLIHGRRGPINSQNERAQTRVSDDGNRCGIDMDALELIEMQSKGVSEYGLDDVPM